MIPKILLSFDVEEFDMPLEYNNLISDQEQFEIGKKGLDVIMPILKDPQVITTLFTTANFAIKYPDTILDLSHQHEIGSHTFYHSNFTTEHLTTSKLKLEEITKKPIMGLRMPRMKQVSVIDIINAGYQYDSSINPTWLPGRYNNLNLPRTVYYQDGLKRIPASVTPTFRIPLFWLSFKNLPYKIFLKLALQTLRRDGYLALYFHPWEFTDISGYDLPKYTTRGCHLELYDKLQRFIIALKTEGEFIKMGTLNL